jgi:hypothetical protein
MMAPGDGRKPFSKSSCIARFVRPAGLDLMEASREVTAVFFLF